LNSRSYRAHSHLPIAAVVSSLIAAAAIAAEPDPQSVAPAQDGEAAQSSTEPVEVVVTGSRISRRDYDSTSPIVTLGEESIAKSGEVNIEATLNQMPQFVQGQTQSNIGAVAAGGRASLNLRGLGETRNLVLLDGRRLPLSNAFGVVDVNLIPQSILEGVETISGGASAVYGSDAMSGVVNFKTRRSFRGIQLDARQGMSSRGDAKTTDASILTGFSIADDRGDVLLSAGYTDRDSLFGSARDFYQLGVLSSFVGTGTFVPSATNLPAQAAVNGVFANYGVAAGAVPTSRSLGFNDDGSLFSQIGTANYKGPSTEYFSTVGGVVRQPVTYQEFVVNPLKRRSFFGKFDFEVNPAVTTYGQFLYNKTLATGQVGWSPTLYNVPSVPVSNPFIPADLRTILASRPNPNATFTLNQRFMGFETREFPADFSVSQTLFGVKGDLSFKDWRWDVYGSYDSMDLVETQDKALLLSRMNTLLAAADGGASLCAGGFNPFGLGNSTSVSQACRDYLETETHDFTKTNQTIFEGNLTGSVMPMPAGDLKFSLVLNYRRNAFDFNPDPARENADVIGTLATFPTQGDVSVKEAALELLVPLLKDKPFAHSLDLDLGIRTSDYDVSGRAQTYKIDAAWKPVSSMLFRGGYERAIRAPNIGELYSAATAAQAQIGSPPGQGDPCDVRSAGRSGANAAALRALCVATGVPAQIADAFQYTTVAVGTLISGSTALTPEKANTVTAGAVFRPVFERELFSNISISLDYYNIDIDNVINVVSGVTAINKCYNLDGTNSSYAADNVYCQLITRDATGGINTVATPYLNLGKLTTSGVDAQLDWSFDLSAIGLSDNAGRLGLNLIGNYTNSYTVQLLPGSPEQEFAGTIDGTQGTGLPLPDWKLLTSVSYRLGRGQAEVRWRHLPGMDDVTAITRPTSPAPGVPSYDLFDANVGFRFSDAFFVRAGANNIFDKEPPQVAGTVGLTQPGTYDIIGRSFYLALQANF
jgi:outer membrane receptor protein involved in Fe transport